MSEKSIQRLKKKFIATSMCSFLLVMLFIAGCIYGVNLALTRVQIRHVMHYIEENDGVLPVTGDSGAGTAGKNDASDKGTDAADSKEDSGEKDLIDNGTIDYDTDGDVITQLQNLFGINTAGSSSPEFYYATRYFSVIFDQNGSVTHVLTSHIASIEDEGAVAFARQMQKRFFRFGSYGDFYYDVAERTDGGTIVTVLDCSAQIAMSRRIIMISLVLIGAGMLISFLLLRVWAEHLVRPEIRNAEMQKSFITNASHELKTPLAVIRANTEMQEMSGQESEWTHSTMRQVDRLTGLIQNLVTITRAQEKDAKEDRVPTDFTAAVRETVDSFMPVAEQDGKEMTTDIQDNVRMTAHEGDLRQLATLLIDNAIKYCDDGGTIRVSLCTKGRKGQNILFSVSNTYAAGKDTDYTRFFERFYRGDESHNTERGGYGIGLSIAQSLMERYHGDITASWADGVITFLCSF